MKKDAVLTGQAQQILTAWITSLIKGKLLLQLLVLMHTHVSTGQQIVQLCGNFQADYHAPSMYFVTPNYPSNYPDSTTCDCVITTISSRAYSLNVTVEHLDLEACSTVEGTDWDYLDIEGTYQFQNERKVFRYCADDKFEHDSTFKEPPGGNIYGIGNTVTSTGYVRIKFQADESINKTGAKLLIESPFSKYVRCTSNLDLEIPTTTIPPDVPVVSSSESPSESENQEEEKTELSTKTRNNMIAGSVAGTVVVLLIVGAGVIYWFIVKKMRAKQTSGSDGENGERRQSTPYYHDPCMGKPALPHPDRSGPFVTDEYLYMNPSSPVYANADPNAANNGGAENGAYYKAGPLYGDSSDEHHYINPDTRDKEGQYEVPAVNGEVESVPLLTSLALANKKPLPLPKIQPSPSKGVTKSDAKLQPDHTENHSSTNIQIGNISPEYLNSDDTGPALIKPSELKGKSKLPKVPLKPPASNSSPDNVKFRKPQFEAPKIRPPILKKPGWKKNAERPTETPPKPPPTKPKPTKPVQHKEDTSQDEAYEIVEIQTRP